MKLLKKLLVIPAAVIGVAVVSKVKEYRAGKKAAADKDQDSAKKDKNDDKD